MHLAWVDRNNIAGFRLHDAASAHGFLRAAQDDANPELVMGMPTERMRRIGRDRIHAIDSATDYLKPPLYHYPMLYRVSRSNQLKLAFLLLRPDVRSLCAALPSDGGRRWDV